MMRPQARGMWLLACCCLLVAARAQQDDVLRFLSRDQMARLAQKTRGPGSGSNDQLLKLKQVENLAAKGAVSDVICPGSQTSCPDGTTCCKMSTGGYGCCPQPNAVCCSDGIHCCPHGTTCDVSAGTCASADKLTFVPWETKQPARALKDVQCPDGQSRCPDGTTCCKMPTGAFGCCPLPNAVCCSDDIHCCPQGTTCNLSAGTCTSADTVVPWETKQPARAVKDEVCPGGQTACPDGTTCCKMSSGDYGCCPQPNAVCCSDGLHCCPQGTTCNLSAGTCTSADTVVPWETKQPARPVVDGVICPDGEECGDGTTCCKLTDGSYGCCPYPEAVCCKDNRHCCPNGFTCNLASQKCDKGANSMPMLTKQPPASKQGSRSSANTQCPDGSQCPSGQTCCMTNTEDYGCCPVPNAVCCSDHVHCCPSGYKCNVGAGTCERETELTPVISKSLSASSVEGVVCPDKRSMCADGQTCCKMRTGEYGCCPRPNAVCCQDHVHCCPQGYTCDTGKGTCLKGHLSLPWDVKQPAVPSF